jgi:hypothetical protein
LLSAELLSALRERLRCCLHHFQHLDAYKSLRTYMDEVDHAWRDRPCQYFDQLSLQME